MTKIALAAVLALVVLVPADHARAQEAAPAAAEAQIPVSIGIVDIDRGEVTAGGVSLDEVDPRTMRSRRVKGLFMAGEILDIAGRVGGYNLQAAFSTGYVAGAEAATEWMESNTH